MTTATSVVANYTYSPYGVTTATGPYSSHNDYRFTGREYEAEDLYYYRSRFYNPQAGRFISPDPLGIYDDINYYRYVRSNPVRYTDPSGQALFIPPAIAFGKCMAECVGFNKLMAEITGCGGLGAANCAIECINPLNWLPIKLAKRAQKLQQAVKKSDKVSNKAGKGLGNPFKDKSAKEIDRMFKDKGFRESGPDPLNGKGGYVNPKTGRSYHIDPKEYGKYREPNHVDVNRPRDYKGVLDKKKLPYKE